MSTIPKLNLRGSDEHTQALNRWADSVTTAFADQLSKVHATNQQAHTANAAASAASTSVTNLGNTPVVAPDPVTGNMQQGSLNKLPVAPRLVTPITQDHLVDGTTFGRVKQTELTSGTVHQLNNGTDVRTVTAAAGAFDTSGNVTLKNVASASGNPGTPDTTNSTSFIRMLNMVITVVNKGNPVLITFNGALSNNTAGHNTVYALFRDGSQLSGSMTLSTPTANGIYPACLIFMDVPSAASHTYEIKWLCASGSIATAEVGYQMQLIELG